MLVGAYPQTPVTIHQVFTKFRYAYLIQKYNISRREFCYIGDTVQDIQTCQKAGVSCLSAAWQKNANATALEMENPNCVFSCVQDIYNYFELNFPTIGPT